MRSHRVPACVVAAIVALAGTSPSVAQAEPTKRECIDANAQAQALQKRGKLRDAQASLRACSATTCPGAVRDDCAQRLDALERTIPSVVFEVKDPRGGDLSEVRVMLDGSLLTERIDGTAIELDPGEHVFTFEATGQPTVTKNMVLREGERGRRERIVLGTVLDAVVPPSPSTSPAVPAPAASPRSEAGGESSSGQRTAAIVVGISGLVGIGVGGLLGGLASSSWSSSQSQCRSELDCVNRSAALDDRASAVSQATGANIAFVAGAVLLVTATVLYFTARTPGGATSALHRKRTLDLIQRF